MYYAILVYEVYIIIINSLNESDLPTYYGNDVKRVVKVI